MFLDVMLLMLAAVVAYFVGTINFSKIIAWRARKKDITTIGSHNPGAMNMLRSFGFGLALLTFVAEVAKAGVLCIVFKYLYEFLEVWGGGEFVYYLVGFFLMIGYNFPIWSGFKGGGKGVACFAGIFIFSSIWYVSLGWFVVCFILFIFIDIGSVISFTYTGGLTIATTVFTWVTGSSAWVSAYITIMVWILFALTLYRHKANIQRLIHHTENKVGFKGKLKNVFCHNKGERIIDEAELDAKAEAEIIIDEQNDYDNSESDGEESSVEDDVVVDNEEEISSVDEGFSEETGETSEENSDEDKNDEDKDDE